MYVLHLQDAAIPQHKTLRPTITLHLPETSLFSNLDKTLKNRYTHCHDETFIYQRLKTETYPIRRENRHDGDFQRARNWHRHAPREKC